MKERGYVVVALDDTRGSLAWRRALRNRRAVLSCIPGSFGGTGGSCGHVWHGNARVGSVDAVRSSVAGLILYVSQESLCKDSRWCYRISATISGDTINIEEELAPGSEARTEYRGTEWTVRNVGARSIAAGTRAKVVKVDGLTLHIEAE